MVTSCYEGLTTVSMGRKSRLPRSIHRSAAGAAKTGVYVNPNYTTNMNLISNGWLIKATLPHYLLEFAASKHCQRHYLKGLQNMP
jgi:hypothetical protein